MSPSPHVPERQVYLQNPYRSVSAVPKSVTKAEFMDQANLARFLCLLTVANQAGLRDIETSPLFGLHSFVQIW